MELIVAILVVYMITSIVIAVRDVPMGAKETKGPRRTNAEQQKKLLPRELSYKDIQSGKVHIDWRRVKVR
ncbi:MAG: hypothetical protein QW376_07730 [Candidatus Caldarchaeum sp.]